MRTIITEFVLARVANLFFGQKNFNFIEVGPHQHQLKEKDFSMDLETKNAEEEVFVPSGLTFG